MGIINSHEAARAPLGSRQEMKHYKPAPKPSVTHCIAEPGKAQCPPPAVHMGKIKLDGLASGDATTCCTTTCGSSLSGASASPEVDMWRAEASGTTNQQITITLSTDSYWERSLSARAVSSIGEQSPRGLNPEVEFFSLEADCKTAPKPSRWHRRTPRVGGVLATLRRCAVRGRSQPPSGTGCEQSSDSRGHEATPASGCNSAVALRSHVRRAEEDNGRRRHSDILGPSSAASTINTERRPSTLTAESLRRLRDNLPLSGNLSRPCGSSADCQISSTGALPIRHPCNEVRYASAPEPSFGKTTSHEVGGRLDPLLRSRRGVTTTSWIADAPPDGRWEFERGVWNRQGVHHNQLNVVDERFKAFAATRLLSPPQQCGQPHGNFGRSPAGAMTQPRGVPVAALAGKMKGRQQMLLQAGHPVAPITQRGVAAATTIEIAKGRQATEERRRHQQRHIAPSGAVHKAIASSNTAEKSISVTLITSTRGEGPAPAKRLEEKAADVKRSCRNSDTHAADIAGATTYAGRSQVRRVPSKNYSQKREGGPTRALDAASPDRQRTGVAGAHRHPRCSREAISAHDEREGASPDCGEGKVQSAKEEDTEEAATASRLATSLPPGPHLHYRGPDGQVG